MKTHKAILTFFFIAALFFNLSGQKGYVDADVHMLNGDIIETQVKMPVKAADKKIKLKENADAELQKVASDDVDYMILKSGGEAILLRRAHYHRVAGKKASKKKFWLNQRFDCQNFTTYVAVAEFDMNRNGDFYEVYADGIGAYMIQSTGEKNPTQISFIFLRKMMTTKMFDKQRRKFLEAYYKNDKETMAYLKSKKRITQEELSEFLEERCVEQ